MKKKYLLGMALMASLAFSACDKEVVYVEDGQSAEQVITLQVDNGGDGLVTRGGRPLYSSEAKQSIENVRLWICDQSGNVVLVKDYNNWMGTDGKGGEGATSTDYANGRQAVLKLTGDDKLEKGTYKVYALGYSNNSSYNLETITTLTKGTKYEENTVLALKSDGNEEEIFAGSIESLEITDKALKQNIVLNRQVAGAYVYVKDIPYFEGARYLKLVASTGNNSLVLGKFANTDITTNGRNTAKYVVNGTGNKTGEYLISEIDLEAWFGTDFKGSDGLIETTNWTNPLKNDKTPTFQKGSVFGGAFVIPFKKNSEQTLKLVLSTQSGVAETGESVKMSWNINLPSTDGQVGAHEFVYWDASWQTSSSNSDSQNVYSIVRNHLYSVGTRNLDDPSEGTGTDPEPPVDPEDPNDNPESLNNKKELTLIVNDNWEVIHEMELD